MKLVSQYLEKIHNVEWFPILSMLLFFAIFLIIGIWVFKLPKSYIKQMENWPNEEDKNDA